MKEALEREGLNCHLMVQPVGYHTPDSGRTGFQSLPECPFGKRFFDMVNRLAKAPCKLNITCNLRITSSFVFVTYR